MAAFGEGPVSPPPFGEPRTINVPLADGGLPVAGAASPASPLSGAPRTRYWSRRLACYRRMRPFSGTGRGSRRVTQFARLKARTTNIRLNPACSSPPSVALRPRLAPRSPMSDASLRWRRRRVRHRRACASLIAPFARDVPLWGVGGGSVPEVSLERITSLRMACVSPTAVAMRRRASTEANPAGATDDAVIALWHE
jgi:hypothetical protein